MAQCLAGAESAILAFQGGGYLSAGKVDHGGVKVVAEAARTAGVQRLVLISSLFVTDQHKKHPLRIMLNTIRWKLMDRKKDGEDRLRESGLPYCIVRPGRFVIKPAGSEAKLKAGQGDTLNGSISPVDVAEICVAALRDPNATGVTFEVIDEWAKAPEEKVAEDKEAEGAVEYPSVQAASDDGASAAAGSGGASGQPGRNSRQSVQQQLPALFRGLLPDSVVAGGASAIAATAQAAGGRGSEMTDADSTAQQLYGMKVQA
jgi:uncharacterized protein YbjT (DUF2867 family)